jgi:hypothetical protein
VYLTLPKKIVLFKFVLLALFRPLIRQSYHLDKAHIHKLSIVMC